MRVPVAPADILRANQAARDGDLAFARRDFYASLIKYLEASRANPNSEFIQNKLGITYSQLKYYREATEAFMRSIALNPKYPYSYNNLGSIHFAQNDKRAAERSFKKAISLDPDVAAFHLNLGSLYFEKRRPSRGLAAWRKALALDPSILQRGDAVSLVAAGSQASKSERSYFMARLFAAAGNVVAAVESLQQAVQLGFSDFDAIRREPDFDPIRQDPRFKELMKTVVLLAPE